ncbi:MAG: hypothetical protein ALECFALPRED_008763 [Alectoria fallacina]|uniref:Uncharacterized protein n=1 Tax=Alectoria fallacina TaxID=1903189 RepID=A0A8H3J4L0_9LECA|nr:MAG: hypothetical protein ALECFALPRED_008763 [Alectoria fallacina]
MRSSAILVVALVGVASAGMPKWPRNWPGTANDVYGGSKGPTGKPHLGPGPVSEIPHTGGSFPTGHPKDHHTKKEHHNSGGMFPSGGPKEHHSEKHHHTGGSFPTGKHHQPTGSGVGPTGTGHGASPLPTPGPHTTTITKTSDVASKSSIGRTSLPLALTSATGTMTSTLFDTTTLTSTITKYVPCSSPIATVGSSTFYSTSLTTTYSITTVTQTSTTYEVICPSTTGPGVGGPAPTGGAGSPPYIPVVPTGGSIALESPGAGPTSTPIGGESGAGSGSGSGSPGSPGAPGEGGATNTAYGSIPTSGSGSGGYPGVPASPSNGCPAVQTVTSTVQVTVTVTSTAGAGGSGGSGTQPTSGSGPPPPNGPFSTQSGAAPFPLPGGPGSVKPFPSGTGAPSGHVPPTGTGIPSGGYAKQTGGQRWVAIDDQRT